MKYVHTKDAPEAIGPYSQAILEQKTLYTSGQLGIDPKTQDFVSNDIEGQTKQVLKNIESILSAEDFKITDVCKVTIYLKDLSVFNIVNDIYQSFFKDHKPARSTIEVSKLPKNGLIEIDVIAQKS
jgi:2-iminobutanoate/2-iminopropanoate deaminase